MGSRCCYILKRIEEGVELAKEAFNIQPENLQHGVQLAKLLAAKNLENEAVDVLKKIILHNKFYFLEVFKDEDFINKPQIIASINEFADNLIKHVTNDINRLSGLLVKGRQAEPIFHMIINLTASNDYLSLRKVDEELIKDRKWSYKHFDSIRCTNPSVHPVIEQKEVTCSIAKFIQIENDEVQYEEKYNQALKNALDYLSRKTNKKEQRHLIIKGIPLLLLFGICIYLCNSFNIFIPFIDFLAKAVIVIISIPVGVWICYWDLDDY